MKAPVEQLVRLLDTEQFDRNLFRSYPIQTELSSVFGGQVLAQSLDAAIKTVNPDRLMHSMHAYFLLPGDIYQPIIYEVDSIRDGGSFATRRVVGLQDGKAIFTTAVSFKLPEEGLEHQVPMPDIPGPEDLLSDAHIEAQQRIENPGFKPHSTGCLTSITLSARIDLTVLLPKLNCCLI